MARKGKAKVTLKKRKAEAEAEDSEVEANNHDFLMTDPKSALVHTNLIEAVSTPTFWPSLTQEERDSILELIPDFIERNEDGSIPEQFWRYNNEWRAAVRQFQEDLSLGKYDPQWLADAAQAMEERARGDFDAWKEKEFEEFWGQKQKVAHTARAGVATNIKLEKLISQGLFRIGDIWSYARCFGRGEQAVVVEKDCELVGIKAANVTFEMPRGTKKYRSRAAAVTGQVDGIPGNELTIRSPKVVATAVRIGQANESITQEKSTLASAGQRLDGGGNSEHMTVALQSPKGPSLLGLVDENEPSIPSSPLSSARSDVANPTDWARDKVEIPVTAMHHGPNEYKIAIPDSDTITYSIRNLGALETKILNVDGRVKDVPNGNAWKTFRLIRHNQDLGSLFDVRDKYCVDFGV